MPDSHRGDPPPRTDDTLFVLSQEDIDDILADAYVDIRQEVADDATAADVVTIVRSRFQDPFYYQPDADVDFDSDADTHTG